MDAANITDNSTAADNDTSLYASGLELIDQLQACLGKMKDSKQKRKLMMQHSVPGSGGGSSNSAGEAVGAVTAVGAGSNNASSGSRTIHQVQQQQQQPLLVLEKTELKLRIKLDTWMSESGELIIQPSLLADDKQNGESQEEAAGFAVQEHGDGGPGQRDSGGSDSDCCSHTGSRCGDGHEAGDAAGEAGAGAIADAGSHGNGSDSNNSSNRSSRSNSADSSEGGSDQQRQAPIHCVACVASSLQQQQQNSGDLPQHATETGVTKTGRYLTYKDLGVTQGQLKQHQLQQQRKERQPQPQQHRARIADSSNKRHIAGSTASSANESKFQQSQQSQRKSQHKHQQVDTDKVVEKKVTTAKKNGKAAVFAGDSALQKSSCHRFTPVEKIAKMLQ